MARIEDPLTPEESALVRSGAYKLVRNPDGTRYMVPSTDRPGLNWPAPRFFGQPPNSFIKRQPGPGEK